MKTCLTCQAELPLEAFYAKQSRCRECVKQALRDRRAADPEAERKRDAVYRARRVAADHDRLKRVQREWHQRNRERSQEKWRAWAAANPDRRAAYARAWAAANPEKQRERVRRRRAALRGAVRYTVTERDLRRIYGSPCWACGSTDDVVWDHVVPIARGGSHGIGNALSLCRSCNASKQDQLLVEWRNR